MARTYEATHPWLTFGLDVSRFDHRLWLALGEAVSKCEHIAGVPLSPAAADEMLTLYLAKGASATTAIEGNTLSEEQAAQVIAGTLRLPPSQQYLADEIHNIVDAFNEIRRKIEEDGIDALSLEFIKRLNCLVLKGLQVDPDVVPGEVRQHRVMVRRYRCAPPEDCEYLLDKLCKLLNSFPAPTGEMEVYAIIKAIFAHLYLVWIHPFGDGNGRTARLIELYILLAAGFAQPAGHLLSNHYNKTRQRYYDFLDQAIRSLEAVIDFIRYSVTGLVEGLREQIEFIRGHQWQVAWTNYVHEMFREKNSTADVRRRHLVLGLSSITNPLEIARIPGLTPELAAAYSGKTPKTVVRDINALVEMDLVERNRNLVRAKREKILAFLPWRNVGPEEDQTAEAA